MSRLRCFLLVATLWFSDAYSAISVPGAVNDDLNDLCPRVPVERFLNLSDVGKINQRVLCQNYISIDGEITAEDGRNFVKLVNWYDTQYRRGTRLALPIVALNSAGGSVVASMMIAKAIRESAYMRDWGATSIQEDAKCYSACVIILAGSYQRNAWGKVGIHRPYFVGDEYSHMGYQNLQQAYDGLYEQLSKLFKHWNLSTSLVDDMFAVSSTSLRILSKRELDAYGLDKMDRVLGEQYNGWVREVCGEEALAESGGWAGTGDENLRGWWLSKKGQECAHNVQAFRKESAQRRYPQLIKKHCGEAAANAYERGGGVSESCAKKVDSAFFAGQ
jgi:hypothetical protein